MISLILFLTSAPAPLASDLALAGFRVFEALAISEVLHLIETENIDAVVVAPDVMKDLGTIQDRRITLKLKPNATVADAIWELAQLFPAQSAVQ